MPQKEFIEKWKDTMYYLNHESFQSDLDKLLKERAVEFMQHHYKIRGATLTDEFTNDLYDTFINE